MFYCRCIFNASHGDAETLRTEVDSEMFRALVRKDLVINVYKDGAFGSFSQIPILSLAGEFLHFFQLITYSTHTNSIIISWKGLANGKYHLYILYLQRCIYQV